MLKKVPNDGLAIRRVARASPIDDITVAVGDICTAREEELEDLG